LTYKNITNYIVTNGPIVPTIAKLLLFGLNKYFPIHCIYSSRYSGKKYCFNQIMKRHYGCDVLVVGDGFEEEQASKEGDIPFKKIQSIADLHRLKHALEQDIERLFRKDK